MAGVEISGTAIRAGVWYGRAVRGDGAEAPVPAVSAWHLERRLEGVTVAPAGDRPGTWEVAVPIPAEILSDGVQTVLIRDDASGEVVESLTLVAGAPLAADLRAEIALLRAELDMLKRAFRRHCVETG